MTHLLAAVGGYLAGCGTILLLWWIMDGIEQHDVALMAERKAEARE